jgi:uncharacterized protein (DUF488 family)
MVALPEIWTVGHSTHSPADFSRLLASHAIEQVADVRTVPRSRRHPHFSADEMARWLPHAGVRYAHLAQLGGWKRVETDSPNDAWRNRSFRGYADYATGPEFAGGLDELLALATSSRTAVMCSESLWWRCHRRLIADRITVAGGTVRHIGSDGRTSEHKLTPFAVVDAHGEVTYPAHRG